MAWYTTGTIAVSGTTVTGTGTNWLDNKQSIGAGQALLIPGSGTVKMYEIASVTSATKLTLKTSPGTIAAGQAYAILSFYTDSVPDFARRLAAQLSYYQSQMDGWQQIMTGTGNVTLTAPDGTSVTISSFAKLTADVSNLTTSVAGKLNSDLPTLRKLFTSALVNPGDNWAYPGVTTYNNNLWGSVSQWGTVLTLSNSDVSGNGANGRWFSYIQIDTQGNLSVAANINNSFFGSYKVWTTKNTTVDGSGFIKRASPIARITANLDSMTEDFTSSFNLAGSGAVNEEAEGVTVEGLGNGNYRISGADGLARDGWQIEVPKDINGNRLCFVEVTEAPEGILIKVFRPKLDLDTGGIIAGEQFDIPDGRWIDVRLEMPADSEYNLRMQQVNDQMKPEQ